ncbi:hypothetical protein [Aeromonas caviae]|uniref:hypothetical protein n=1 Tax=Aeromonas caviae TaxID=648 RepID=UPI0029DBCF01|nr:hypothetical protein [Aeromonas caviae]MDX7766106.1 hypothetical protein [Aeromonas caviae]
MNGLEEELDLRRLDGGERLLAIAELYGNEQLEIPIDTPSSYEEVMASSKRFIRDYRASWNSIVKFGADKLRSASAMEIKNVAALLSQICDGPDMWDNNPASPIEGYSVGQAISLLVAKMPDITITTAPEHISEAQQDLTFLDHAIYLTAESISSTYGIKLSTLTHGGFCVDLRSVTTRLQMVRAIPLLLLGAQSSRSESLAAGLDKLALRNGYRDENEMAESIHMRFNLSRSSWANATIISMIDESNDNTIHAACGRLMRLIRRMSISVALNSGECDVE